MVENMRVVKNQEHTGARRLNIIFKIVNAAIRQSMSNSDNSAQRKNQFTDLAGKRRIGTLPCGS
jgi:hypothetical protein